MDRRLLVLLACWLGTAAGCGGGSDQGPTAESVGPPEIVEGGLVSGEHEDEGGGLSQSHRPVIVGPIDLHPGAGQSPATSGPPRLTTDPTFHPTGETPRSFFPPDEAAPPVEASSAEPTFSAAGNAFNPLRTDDDPGEPNPLRIRSFASPPRMSEPPETASEFVPSAVPSAAASIENPAGSADPTFQPMAIDPSGGVRATGPAAPETTAEPALAAPAANPFDVVQVFYGTDRAAIEPAIGDVTAYVLRFLPAGFCVLVTLCLVLIAVSKRSTALWVVSAVSVLASIGLSYQAASNTLFAIRWEGKVGPQYTIDRAADGKVQLGVCEVTIPKSHDPGVLESPSILRLEVREDAAQHVVLSKTERLEDERFYELLRERVQQSPRKELFVFIHGFNTQFEDAARRTAQIHYDLKFQGAPIFYSWPSNNKSLLTYPADETAIGWSTPHLKQFLLAIVKRSEAQSINLIAHSMGNRGLTVALREIELEFRGQSRLFNHVVLAAPDIDADDFRTNIAPAMQRTANHVTLYASSRDDALRVSQLLHRGPRAGDSGPGLVIVPGMDTIDVTAIDSSPWGHVYYGASDPVLQDLKHLFLYGFPPQERRWLSPAQREGLTYWIFEATQTAARDGFPPR